ncbi:hypothetical protein BY458DRAFT_560089 [Sporodiniella umbellata]|nr:hypothetical protein BY458DRAFT_560089 [Sporodiniella umbellata]
MAEDGDGSTLLKATRENFEHLNLQENKGDTQSSSQDPSRFDYDKRDRTKGDKVGSDREDEELLREYELCRSRMESAAKGQSSQKRSVKAKNRSRPSEAEIRAKRQVAKESKPSAKKVIQRSTEKVSFHPTASYLSVSGTWIDSVGSQADRLITEHMQSQRIARDGEGYHITFINHVEIRARMSDWIDPDTPKRYALRKALDGIEKAILSQHGPALGWELPVDLGLGRCYGASQEAVTYFRVLAWPFGQSMRSALGFGFSNFHITCGYTPTDVHQYKGPATLLCLEKASHCSLPHAQLLMSVIQYYAHDRLFLDKLYEKLQDQDYKDLLYQFHATDLNKANWQ